MLVLTRKTGQSVMIGQDVVVTVFEVRGETVRLGIAAPREVAVHREEVYRELQRANQTAASPSAAALESFGRLLPAGPAGDRPEP